MRSEHETGERRRLRSTTRACLAFALLAALGASPAHAGGPERWQLTLDWTPQYCRDHLSSKEVQCTEELYFVLGGLKPVFTGEAPDCASGRLPAELMDDARLDVPNRAKLARMWSRDGACSGLSASDYVLQVGRASRRFAAPPDMRRVPANLRMSPQEVRAAFVGVNADLAPAHLVPLCRARSFSAVMICVDANFQPVACPVEVENACGEDFPVRGFSKRQLRGVDG